MKQESITQPLAFFVLCACCCCYNCCVWRWWFFSLSLLSSDLSVTFSRKWNAILLEYAMMKKLGRSSTVNRHYMDYIRWYIIYPSFSRLILSFHHSNDVRNSNTKWNRKKIQKISRFQCEIVTINLFLYIFCCGWSCWISLSGFFRLSSIFKINIIHHLTVYLQLLPFQIL